MNLQEILSLVIIAIGFAVVYSAKLIVKKFQLAEKQKCVNASQMSEEEIQSYKLNKAVFNIKLMGLIISIPGLILFIISFR
ncbi:hypothetical protein [Ruminiclostridium cellobioparum]|jgi:hypothetical protein|uniref:hypothetical protein n=1 Tax=Ruminiclostridium cellobioparum TaxID=29355 RepID=UPI0028B02C38|nr:hypothetical protein [Ruminiclostridium cellobioparum]